MSWKRCCVGLAGLVVSVLALLTLSPTPNGYAQGTSTLTLNTVTVGVAETATLEGRIACSASACNGFTLTLRFDRDLLRVSSASVGPYLGANVFTMQNAIDNASGTVQLAAAALQPPPAGVENVLFQLEVEGLIPGEAEVTVESLEIVDASGQTVPSSGIGTAVTVYETGKIPFFSPPVNAWQLVFITERDGNPEVYTIMANGSGLRRLTETEALEGGPRWSPDGARIAFHSNRDGNLEIYTMDDQGGDVRRLTDHAAADFSPTWSPDGTQIAFVSERDGNPEIYVMNADGTNVRRLTDDPATDTTPAWSPDGKQIAFVSDRGGSQELYLMDADGNNAAPFSELFGSAGWHPAWKPDGTQLSFAAGNAGAVNYYRTPLPAAPYQLSHDGIVPTRSQSAWSPDGNYLALMSTQTGVSDLYVLDLGRERWFKLTEDQYADYDPDWRPIGTPCAISTEQDDVRVHVGPGRNRGVFGYLPKGRQFTVIGQAQDDKGAVWWELDKSEFDGGEMVNSLWVKADDVRSVGSCAMVSISTPPPLIPYPTPPGSWLPCGSCDSCGHPASECVTSPDGECLWDPDTCGNVRVTPPPQVTSAPQCYTVTVTSSLGGSAWKTTPGNCTEDTYTMGSSVGVHAEPQGAGWYVLSWSGTCGNIPSPGYMVEDATVTVNGNCTVHIRFSYLG